MTTYDERPDSDTRQPTSPGIEPVDPKDPSAILQPRPGGLAERIGTRLRNHRPAVAGLIVDVCGYVLITTLMIGLGLLITKTPQLRFIPRWDESANNWFVTWRTSAINEVTRIGSDLGATTTIIGIAALTTIVLAIGRWWRQIGLLLGALAIEASGALTSSLVVARPRPTVPYLDAAPPTTSFPSGHTAAAIVLYVCLAIILTSIFRSFVLRVAVWSLAVLLPAYVGFSRLYRGMHHPTDVMGSVVLAAGALLFGMLGVRSAVRVAEIRERASATVHELPPARRDQAQTGIGA